MRKPRKMVLTLCGTQGCCPTVEIKDDGVLIKDDHGGMVRLNSEQWKDLKEKLLGKKS